MASDNPFYEPLDGDKGSVTTPEVNVFGAPKTANDLVEEESIDDAESPFALDQEERPVDSEIPPLPEPDPEPEPIVEPGLDWESVFSSVPQAIVILDAQQKVLYTNAAHEELLGVDAAQLVDGMTGWFEAVCEDPEKRGAILDSWHQQIWRNQLTRTFELNSQTKGVRKIEFRSAMSPDGEMVVIQTDVTDDMATDEALRQANLKYRSLFNHSAGGVISVNRDGEILEANDAFVEFAGVSSDSLTGVPFASILNEEDATSIAVGEQSNGVPRKLRFQFEGQEQEKPALVTPSFITNQENEAMFTLYLLKPRDAKLIAKLHDLSAKAQSLLDAVPNLFVLIDREGIIKDWSPPTREWDISVGFDENSIGRAVRDVWPAFGHYVDARLEEVFGGATLREEVIPEPGGPSFAVTMSSFGSEMALALVEAPSMPEVAEVAEAPQPVGWQDDFFDHAKEAVLVISADGEVVEANRAATVLLGRPKAALTSSSLFQLVSKAPGTDGEFDLGCLRELKSEKVWADLLSVSENGPQSVAATVVPVAENERVDRFVVMVQPKQVQSSSLSDIQELAQCHFRSQLQVITSLFSISPDSSDSKSFTTWLIRLKVLAESMTHSKRVGVIHLLRDIADQVASVAGRGLGAREVVLSGSSALTIDNEIATPFALLVGEIMSLGVTGGEAGPGPSVYIDVEYAEGNIVLTAKPGENRGLFTSNKMGNAKIIEILVEQIRGKILMGVGDDDVQSPSLRLTFPSQQS